MTSGNRVTLTFAGDESDLTRSIDTVGRSTRDMSETVGAGANHIDRVGESADQAETRFTGLASGIDGVTTLMDDPSPQEFAQGLADMADGVANFVVPTVKRLATALIDNGRAAVTSAAQHAVAAARTAASWVVMGVQAMVNAAKMAAAWLISLGPVGLVIAAVGAVIGVLVALGVGFDDVARFAQDAWNLILGAAQAVWGWLESNWPLVLGILTGPIGLAVLAIRAWGDDLVRFFAGIPGRIGAAASGMWNWIVDSFRAVINTVIGMWNNFKIPGVTIGGWDPPGPGPTIPSVTTPTINFPDIPYLHEGGVFRAPGGRREGLAMLLDGEQVSRPGSSGAVVHNHFHIQGSIIAERQLVGIVRDEIGRGGIR